MRDRGRTHWAALDGRDVNDTTRPLPVPAHVRLFPLQERLARLPKNGCAANRPAGSQAERVAESLAPESRRPFPIVHNDRIRIASQQRAAAFMRIGLRAMRADFFREMPADPEFCSVGHNYSSSQKRSFTYFDAESAKIVTITAFAFFGIPAATWKQPSSAAAALGLTSKPSSRARRFTSR